MLKQIEAQILCAIISKHDFKLSETFFMKDHAGPTEHDLETMKATVKMAKEYAKMIMEQEPAEKKPERLLKGKVESDYNPFGNKDGWMR